LGETNQHEGSSSERMHGVPLKTECGGDNNQTLKGRPSEAAVSYRKCVEKGTGHMNAERGEILL